MSKTKNVTKSVPGYVAKSPGGSLIAKTLSATKGDAEDRLANLVNHRASRSFDYDFSTSFNLRFAADLGYKIVKVEATEVLPKTPTGRVNRVVARARKT